MKTRYVGLLAFLFVYSDITLCHVRIKIQGSTTVNPVVADAAECFREKGWSVFVDTQGGSSGGIAAVAGGLADIGMSSKSIADSDRRKFPKVSFKEHSIGYDGVALVVSQPVFDGGVKSLTKEQIRQIYESKIRNWKEVGGPEKSIVFFNKEPGRGTWEVFASFLYGNAENAPSVSHPEVGGNEETRTKVARHASAITQLSASWVTDGTKIRALGIKMDSGKEIFPTLENIRNGSYPIRRPLLLVTDGTPNAHINELIQFLLSDLGQELVRKHGYLPLKN